MAFSVGAGGVGPPGAPGAPGAAGLYTVSGTATIVAETVSIVVAHGLGGVPPNGVLVTCIDELGGRDLWVSAIGAVTFTINISTEDFMDHVFRWAA